MVELNVICHPLTKMTWNEHYYLTISKDECVQEIRHDYMIILYTCTFFSLKYSRLHIYTSFTIQRIINSKRKTIMNLHKLVRNIQTTLYLYHINLCPNVYLKRINS